jgi:hypothetical protein
MLRNKTKARFMLSITLIVLAVAALISPEKTIRHLKKEVDKYINNPSKSPLAPSRDVGEGSPPKEGGVSPSDR